MGKKINSNMTKNKAYTERFKEVFAEGHSNARMTLTATEVKVFATKAEGANIWDEDGNKFIEYIGAMGPMLLGHRHPEFVQALKDHLDKESTIYGTGQVYRKDDIELAEKLIEHFPSVELVKLSTSGSEAVQLAIRIARAHTGKTRILRFEGMYHGWLDNVYNPFAVDVDLDKEMPFGPIITLDTAGPFIGGYTQGISPYAREEQLTIPFNDFDKLEKVFKNYHQELAICLVEPLVTDVMGLHPVEGFLERVRELCTKYNVVLCFDEIITAFRVGMSGAQGYFGVTPDLTVFAKAIASGLPFSAVGGKKEVMDIFKKDTVMAGGTFNGYALGVKAALTAVTLYEKYSHSMYDEVAAIGDRLITGMHAICAKHNVPFTTTEAPGMFWTFFGPTKGRIKRCTDVSFLEDNNEEFFKKFLVNLQDEGVLIMFGNRWFFGLAHTPEVAEETLVAFENALVATKEEISIEEPVFKNV